MTGLQARHRPGSLCYLEKAIPENVVTTPKGMVRKAIRALKPGDLVDLCGDPFADPNRDSPVLETELVRIDEVEQETPQCFAVYFDGFPCIGFPPDHMLPVQL